MGDNALRIYHITTADEGIYTCSAENIWGTNNMEAMLTVTSKCVSFITQELISL